MACWTGKSHGDMRRRRVALECAGTELPFRRWLRADQVHSGQVWRIGDGEDLSGYGGASQYGAGSKGAPVLSSSGDAVASDDGAFEPGLGPQADAVVTRRHDVGAMVLTADCAPVALASPEGVFAAVHAGWRGLLAGIIVEAVMVMRSMGASRVIAGLGPCIHVECYEFSEGDLKMLSGVFGESVIGSTARSRPALDLPAAVASALQMADAELVFAVGSCTACSPKWYSYRANRDEARQALMVWRDEHDDK